MYPPNEKFGMKPSVATPPSHLSADSKSWWLAIVEAFELDHHHVRLLLSCCEAWDRADTSRRRFARDGVFVTDRFGQLKSHPGVDVERKARDQFRLLLREIGLDVAPPTETRAPGPAANAHLRLHG